MQPNLRARALIAALLTLAPAFPATAAVMKQLGLEQAAALSEIIVVATIIENPDAAILDDGKPFRRQRVHVDRYIKGGGPSDLVVLSPGGRYTAWIRGVGDREIEVIDGSDCRLPAVGTEALLFLKRRGDAFLIASATHGIVQVRTDEATGRKSVEVLLETRNRVDVEDLADTIRRLKPALDRKADPR